MNKHFHFRSLVIGGIASVVFIIGLAAQSNEPAVGTEKIGRFQITAANGQAFVLDTATGEVWGHYDPLFKSAKIRPAKK